MNQPLTDETDADVVAQRAAQVIASMGAEIRTLTAERNRYRNAWHNARARAADGWADAKLAEARVGDLEAGRRADHDRIAELEPYERLNPQQCPAGKHADWLVDSEYAHACPWCRIEQLAAPAVPVVSSAAEDGGQP